MGSIGINLQEVKGRLARACEQAGRDANIVTRTIDAKPGALTLLAVSKTFDEAAVREAHAAGQRAFGENYVQEALAKIAALGDLRDVLEWHLIGPLQSNKTRAVAEAFDWVHTVDRLKVAERLAAQRPASMPALNVCLQVRIGGEASKSGVEPSDAPALADAVAALAPGRLRLRGLMSIPPPASDFARQRQQHRQLREALQALRERHPALDTLSMGMSADIEAAVAEGATIVRVGSAIFGARG